MEWPRKEVRIPIVGVLKGRAKSSPSLPSARSKPLTEMLAQRGDDRRRQRLSAFTTRMPVWAFTQSRPGRRNLTKRFQLEDKESRGSRLAFALGARDSSHRKNTLRKKRSRTGHTHTTRLKKSFFRSSFLSLERIQICPRSKVHRPCPCPWACRGFLRPGVGVRCHGRRR